VPPTSKQLRQRIQLIGTLDQLASRLDDGDETAIEAAHSHIAGFVLCDDMPTLSMAMRALAHVLEEFQAECDAAHPGYTKEE
jgi:hypothetical protein